MKIGIDRGHNCPPDTGADGIKFEDTVVKKLGDIITKQLEAAGHCVVNCSPSCADSVRESLNKRCKTANNNNCNLYISLHCNASNSQGNGTEVYAISDDGRKYAQPVVNAIASLGFNNRGVKSSLDGGKPPFVLRGTNMPAILIEFFFIDNKTDCDLADKLGLELIAITVVKALLPMLK